LQKKFLVLIGLLLAAGCRPVAQEMVTAADVVGTMAAYTLEAYVPPTAEATITETPIPDPAQGPSVQVTQEGENIEDTEVVLAQELPESHYIWDIWGHRQYFGLGCEASAAVDWAEYFGVTVSEFAFQTRLPFSDNPDLGFVGSVEGPWGQVPPYAYGVHAAPVAKLLREYYGMNAVGEKGLTIEDLQRELASGQPVIAWVIGNCVGGIPYEYIDQEGTPVMVAAYEHVVILTGYDADTIRYMNNGKFYDIPYENFANTWGVLGNMAVYLAD
jgi:uncharacterized protein YvpB